MTLALVNRSEDEKDSVRTPLYFEKEIVVTFCLTNAEKNVGHDAYARLFGEVRELFGLECIHGFAGDAGQKYLLKTKETIFKFKKDFYFGDKILVRMHVREVRGASFVLAALFINQATGEVHAIGEHLIAYAGMDGRPQRLPQELKAVLEMASGKPFA
jgi:acyl-CoA thioesterase FadM